MQTPLIWTPGMYCSHLKLCGQPQVPRVDLNPLYIAIPVLCIVASSAVVCGSVVQNIIALLIVPLSVAKALTKQT